MSSSLCDQSAKMNPEPASSSSGDKGMAASETIPLLFCQLWPMHHWPSFVTSLSATVFYAQQIGYD